MRIFEAERRARFVERQGAGRAGRDFRAQVARQGDDHAQALLGQRLGKLGERALRLLLDLRQLVQYFLRVHCTPFLGIHPSKNARQPQSDDGESLVAEPRQAVTLRYSLAGRVTLSVSPWALSRAAFLRSWVARAMSSSRTRSAAARNTLSGGVARPASQNSSVWRSICSRRQSSALPPTISAARCSSLRCNSVCMARLAYASAVPAS